MTPDIKNLLVTGAFILLMLVLFIWLIRALLPSTREEARQAARDEYDTAGYETMDQVKRKEYSAMGAGIFAILIIVIMIGGLGYLLFTSGFSSMPSDQEGMNTLLVFIPAIALLVMVVTASMRYMKHQQGVLHEFRAFRTKRQKAIDEYEAKRSGKGRDEKAGGTKKEQPRARRGGSYQGTHKQKKRRPPKR